MKKIDTSYALELMDSIIEDNGVPRNIRRVVEEAKNKVKEDNKELGVNVSAAIYKLDDISNDINMPSHTRTDIWTLISELEAIKEKVK
ncbi:MAG: UPF0147 family protein [archaeon]|nr:UPF0147 family protein [Candidatus Micrarchaeota archaeon]